MVAPANMTEEDRIAFLEAECTKLRAENERLRAHVGQREVRDPALAAAYVTTSSTGAASLRYDSPTTDKIALFRSLFRGRVDVYPVRWESKTGRSGYSPACNNEWAPGICEKPRVKCTDCPHQAFPAISDDAVFEHLSGRRTLGMYPLLPDNTTWLVAADFDGSPGATMRWRLPKAAADSGSLATLRFRAPAMAPTCGSSSMHQLRQVRRDSLPALRLPVPALGTGSSPSPRMTAFSPAKMLYPKVVSAT